MLIELLSTVSLFLATIAILVAVHELGHYWAARMCGMIPMGFSLGMGPRIWARLDRHGTVWMISALPIGGFVAFRDGELESRTPLQRIAIYLAGPAANMMLALFFFAAVSAVQPRPIFPPVIETVVAGSETGLRAGDKLLGADQVSIAQPDDLPRAQAQTGVGGEVRYLVERGGAVQTVVDAPLASPVIRDVLPGSPAADAGIRVGDRILAIDGRPAFSMTELAVMLKGGVEGPIALRLGATDGTERDVEVLPLIVGEQARIGIDGQAAVGFATALSSDPSLWMREGFGRMSSAVAVTGKVIGDLIAGNVDSCAVAGPVRMAEQVRMAFDRGITIILLIGALMSLGLGLFNLLPLPVLDGGQIMVASYAALFRREPTHRAYGYLNVIGTVIIVAVMMFGFTNDLRC